MNVKFTATRPYILFTFLLTIFVLTSCEEMKTSDAKTTYKYWAGTNAPADLELLNGQYWQSAHWTLEYIMYLKFKPSEEWWSKFLEQNHISPDNFDWTMPYDAPAWFKPSDSSVRYSTNDEFNQSRYFRDNRTGICYIYEIQL